MTSYILRENIFKPHILQRISSGIYKKLSILNNKNNMEKNKIFKNKLNPGGESFIH